MALKSRVAGAGLLLAGAACLVYGYSRGEGAVILTKAINICLECIGIG